jgi:class 3 adenylate cyclase/tetratricopeptide (TPR) repeat protein
MIVPAGSGTSLEGIKSAEAYASFIPRGLYRRLAEANAQALSMRSAGLCLDVAGFTVVTDRLERGRGEAGIEDATEHLNRCFGAAIAEATNFGGEVVSVTGDGLMILWPCAGAAPAQEPVAELLAACRCALAILDRMQAARSADGDHFAVKISVGAGDVFVGYLEGESSGQLLVAGPLITELSATCALAEGGQILLTEHARRISPAECRARELPERGFALDAVTGESDGPAVVELAEPLHPFEHPRARPPAMPALIDRGQLDWLAELRVATVMFVGFEGLSCADAPSFDLVRRAAARLDNLARAYSGLQEKVQIDDKGPFSLISFGLPPRVGSYRPDQALAAAIAVRRLLKELGITARIGIATGKVFRCPVGTEARQDYTIHGSTVHRAVRFMVQAADRILCDAETRAASGQGYRFTTLEPLQLKGIDSPAAVFELVLEDDWSPHSTTTRPVLGRDAEMSRLRRKLLELKAGRPTITALVGAAGIGKSSVLRAAMQQASGLGVEVLYGSGTPLTVGAPYQAWRQVFLTMFGLRAEDPPPMQRARILDLLAEDPEALALAPLIEAVAPVGIPDNDVTRAMGERARAIARRELLARLIARQTTRAPTLIVFDDAHWLDDMSMKLLVELWLETIGASVLVATRPDEEGGALLAQLAGLDAYEPLSIEGLRVPDVKALLAATLEVEPSDECAAWIHRATSGHPLFTTELAKVLRERGVIACDGNVARFAIEPRALDALSLPSTVEALVTDRLDRLGTVEQLAFKTASAIGIDFSFSLLQAVYPHPGSRPELRRSIDRLIRAGLIVQREATGSETGEHLSFAHATFRQAGYDHLPRGQRRALHLAIAQVLEPAAETDPRRSYALLAFHYRCAAQYGKALRYLDLASELARHEGAFGVAAELSQQALDVWRLPEAASAQGRLSPRDWRVRLARCQTWLGDLDGARRLGCEVLAELGHPFPERTASVAVHCVAAILRQVRRSLWAPETPAPDRLRVLEAGAEAATVVMLAYYYHASAIRLMLAALLATDFASESGERVNATGSYGILAVSAGLLRLTGVERHLLRRYQRNAALSGTGDDRRFYFMYSSMHHVAFCDWERVDENTRQRVDAAEAFIDPYFGNVELTLDALAHYYRGQFAQTRAAFEELHRRAERQHSLQHLAWANYGIAEALLPLGLVEDAIPLLLTAQELLKPQHDNHSRLICQGLLGIAYLRSGDIPRALEAAQDVSALVEATPPNNLTSFEGYASAVEVWLGLAQERPGERRRHHHAAARMLKILARYAAIYPLGRPRLWLYRGHLHWQRDAPRKAHHCWTRALDWAERNRMPYEIARAATTLLTHGSPSPVMAERWTALAETAFRETGAGRDLSPMERGAHAGGRR